jgi:polysaccharide pyruvyl transferase WcaK-like protein
VLIPHPAILRNVVEEYRELVALHAAERSSRIHAQLQDAAFALCAATGARTAEAALAAARQELEAMDVAATRSRPAATRRPARLRRSA